MIRVIQAAKGTDRMILISDSFVSYEDSPEHLRHIDDLVFDANGLLSGSKLTMDKACRNMMMHTNCGICQVFNMAARNPAKAIGMDKEIGTIEPGKRANLVFVDDMFRVQKVMLDGKLRQD
jgi:N-acetylglucosamine-6-phosphate deacetylase